MPLIQGIWIQFGKQYKKKRTFNSEDNNKSQKNFQMPQLTYFKLIVQLLEKM